MTAVNPIAEPFPHKVGARFPTHELARRAMDRVKERINQDTTRVKLVSPEEDDPEKKVESASRDVRRTLVRSHVVLGMVGLAGGGLVATLLLLSQIPVFTSSPVLVVLSLVFLGTIAGLLAGGLISLRPDNASLMEQTREAGAEGDWMVVVHTRHDEDRKEAEHLLKNVSPEVATTL